MAAEVTKSTKNKSAILTIVLVSYFMILLDNSVIFTGIPSIREGLDLSVTQLSWVQDAYTLVFGGLLLLGARAGDIVGRRRLFLVGLVIFATASFLVGAAPWGWWLIAARAFQGIGAAIVAPTSLSLITANFEGRERAHAVAMYAATAGIGASLGMIVGGMCAAWISWRAGFYINVPIAIAMIVAALRYLPETERGPGRFDITGAITATLGIGSLAFGIINASENGWSSPLTYVPVAAGALFLVALVLNEKRAAQPIMPLSLFASFERTGAYLARFLFLGAMMAFFFFTTQFMQGVLGFSPLQAGLGFMPMTVVNFAVAMMVPRLLRYMNSAVLLTLGVGTTFAGMAWLSQLGVGDSYWLAVALPMVLIGAGQGFAFAPLTASGIADVEAKDAGAASGVVNTVHQMGSTLGLAILVTAAATAGSGVTAAALADRVHVALSGSAVLLGLALITVIAMTVRRAAVSRVPKSIERAQTVAVG